MTPRELTREIVRTTKNSAAIAKAWNQVLLARANTMHGKIVHVRVRAVREVRKVRKNSTTMVLAHGN